MKTDSRGERKGGREGGEERWTYLLNRVAIQVRRERGCDNASRRTFFHLMLLEVIPLLAIYCSHKRRYENKYKE